MDVICTNNLFIKGKQLPIVKTDKKIKIYIDKLRFLKYNQVNN
ncbi:MAG: hypothetical protein PWP71_2491 [Clostridia bacterium]|jgi:hypothetical protein|nr:hypothetical protein [Clostridia bacterium]